MKPISCGSCGNVMDLDKVPQTPGRNCSDCGAALDTQALEGKSFDTPEAAAQAKADVAAIAKQAAAAPGITAEQLATLGARVSADDEKAKAAQLAHAEGLIASAKSAAAVTS